MNRIPRFVLLIALLLPWVVRPAFAAPVTELRVMSFNIWVNGGQSLTRCIDAIRTAGADLVGLQECNAATAQTIATSLGFHYLGVNDVSVVSRFPIVSTIPTGGGSGVAIELSPGQRVYLFNCHLAAFPYGPYSMREGRDQAFVLDQEQQTRMPGLNQLLTTLAPYLAGPVPCFLTGDFNAPSHLDYASYPWPTSLACAAAGLLDSYRVLHATNRTYPPAFAYNDPGITWTPLVAQEPNGAFDRIDFVFYAGGDGTLAVESMELDGRNSASPWPSDHRAVLSRFTLAPPVLTDRATQPIPAHGTSNVSLNATVSWAPGTNALLHRVYFGPISPGMLRTNTTNVTFAPGPLERSTTYFWRVDEVTPSGVVTGEVWSFRTAAVNVYEWNFAQGDLAPALGNGLLAYADGPITSNLVSFGVSDGTAVPHLNGYPTRYLKVPALTQTASGLHVTLTGSGPNGGGTYLNQFTLLFDLLLPGPLGWAALFNTNPQNANDADFYVDPTGHLGIGDIGYSAATLATNAWYRIAFAADLAAGVVRYHVNGSQVFSGSAGLDGRFSLYSNVDAGPDLLLFNEGDTSGPYTHACLLSSFAVVDRTLSAAEIAALGGPKDLVIFVQSLGPLTIQRAGDLVRLDWQGGPGRRIQRADALGPAAWQEVAGSAGTNTLTQAIEAGPVFYRLMRP